jgi:HTH-type transcriptional regulator/antitoxin HipB
MGRKLSRTGQESNSAVSGIGATVRQARRAHGLTQTQLAGLAGTGLRFISELERGKPSVALDKTLAVIAVLGLRMQISAANP